MNERRPSWGYCPDDLSFGQMDWQDRARVVGIVAGCIVLFLAASMSL